MTHKPNNMKQNDLASALQDLALAVEDLDDDKFLDRLCNDGIVDRNLYTRVATNAVALRAQSIIDVIRSAHA
jgi:hypothetical protein